MESTQTKSDCWKHQLPLGEDDGYAGAVGFLSEKVGDTKVMFAGKCWSQVGSPDSQRVGTALQILRTKSCTQVWAELASSSGDGAEKAWTAVPAEAEEGPYLWEESAFEESKGKCDVSTQFDSVRLVEMKRMFNPKYLWKHLKTWPWPKGLWAYCLQRWAWEDPVFGSWAFVAQEI